MLCPTYRASLVSGLMGKNKSCSVVQAKLKTILANMDGAKDPGPWQKVWETFPKRNRDVCMQNMRKEQAAEVVLAQPDMVASARALETNITGAFAAMEDVKTSLEAMMDTKKGDPETDGIDYFLKVEAEQQDEALGALERYLWDMADGLYAETATVSAAEPPTVTLSEALSMQGIKNAVVHKAAMRRGTFLEDDALGKDMGTKKRGFMRLGRFNLSGECDGIIQSEKRVVEVKNLLYGLHMPPSTKHYIQLEVYMRMFNMPCGQIRRQCEGKQHRKNVDRDDALWYEITSSLDDVTAELNYRMQNGKAPRISRAKRAHTMGNDAQSPTKKPIKVSV